MLVVAVAATTAAYLALDQQIWQRQTENLSDRAQSEVVRAGALEWAITILAKDAKESKSDNLKEDWAKKLPSLPVEGGLVTGEIIDAQSKFNLNNLVSDNGPSTLNIGIFQHLLKSLEIDPNLSDAVIDWIDSDSNALPGGAEDIDYLQMKTPYRAANQPLQSVEELLLIRGFTPEIVDKLRPFVTALPAPREINVNTAGEKVLSALFYTLPTTAISTLIDDREKEPFTDLEKLKQRLEALADGKLKTGPYGVSSSYFEVIINTQFGRYQGSTQALIERVAGNGGFRRLWISRRLPGWTTSPETKADENPEQPAGENI